MPVKYECSIKSALNVCLVFNCFHVSGYHRRGEAGGGLFLGTPACLQTRDKARAATQGINDKVTIMIMIRITQGTRKLLRCAQGGLHTRPHQP